MEVNPERKSGVEPLRRLDVTQDLLPAASAVLSAPNVMPCIPMDFVDTTERGILLCGLHLVSVSFCPGFTSWRGHSSLFARGGSKCASRDATIVRWIHIYIFTMFCGCCLHGGEATMSSCLVSKYNNRMRTAPDIFSDL